MKYIRFFIPKNIPKKYQKKCNFFYFVKNLVSLFAFFELNFVSLCKNKKSKSNSFLAIFPAKTAKIQPKHSHFKQFA